MSVTSFENSRSRSFRNKTRHAPRWLRLTCFSDSKKLFSLKVSPSRNYRLYSSSMCRQSFVIEIKSVYGWENKYTSETLFNRVWVCVRFLVDRTKYLNVFSKRRNTFLDWRYDVLRYVFLHIPAFISFRHVIWVNIFRRVSRKNVLNYNNRPVYGLYLRKNNNKYVFYVVAVICIYARLYRLHFQLFNQNKYNGKGNENVWENSVFLMFSDAKEATNVRNCCSHKIKRAK